MLHAYWQSRPPERITSVCSGSEAPVLALEALHDATSGAYGAEIDCSVEWVTPKLEFLMATYGHKRFYKDLSEVATKQARGLTISLERESKFHWTQTV